MTLLIEAVSGLFTASSCLERIRLYLISPSRNDYRSTEKISAPSEDSTPHIQAFKNELVDNEKSHLHQSCIDVSQMSASWQPNGPQTLKNLSFNIPPAQLTIVIGPVGCGKSTLLKAILGEVPQFQGVLRSDFKENAYCSQNPWLVNATIKENILGISPFNQLWYERVVHACGLEKDLSDLPMGDQTIIGSKGAALSGGQQARVVCFHFVSYVTPVNNEEQFSWVETASVMRLPDVFRYF